MNGPVGSLMLLLLFDFIYFKINVIPSCDEIIFKILNLKNDRFVQHFDDNETVKSTRDLSVWSQHEEFRERERDRESGVEINITH